MKCCAQKKLQLWPIPSFFIYFWLSVVLFKITYTCFILVIEGNKFRFCTMVISTSTIKLSPGWHPRMCSKSRTKSRKSIEKCWTSFWRKTSSSLCFSVSEANSCSWSFWFFSFQTFSDEHNQQESTAALEKLENIDSETDNLDITFVKMADSRYAKKWGVTKLPAMVYFRRRFPSIYRGGSYLNQKQPNLD